MRAELTDCYAHLELQALHIASASLVELWRSDLV